MSDTCSETSSSARSPQPYASSNIARSRSSSGPPPGIESSKPAASRALSKRGRREGRRGVATSSAGFSAIRPCSRWLLKSVRSAACLRQMSDVAAHLLGANRRRLEALHAGPCRELREIRAVGAARARRCVSPPQVCLQQLDRIRPHRLELAHAPVLRHEARANLPATTSGDRRALLFAPACAIAYKRLPAGRCDQFLLHGGRAGPFPPREPARRRAR